MDNTLSGMLDLRRTKPDRFTGISPGRRPGTRMFGGALLAMMTKAAALTVDPSRAPHALHAFFLSSGVADAPTEFKVERTYDGGSFCARSVSVWQEGRIRASASVSFQVPEDGMDIPTPIRPDAPRPMADFPRNPVIEGSEITLPFDVREVDVRSLTGDARGRPRDTSRMLWARVTEEIDDDPLTRSCIVAYISDFGATIGARTLVGATTKTPGRFASLNHTLWWHRPFELSDWLLIDFRPLTAASSRGLVSATVHTADGRHVATLNQEAMMRLS